MKMDASAFVADPELIALLERHASPLICDHDVVLFEQGSVPKGLYLFHAGRVRLTMTSHAGDLIMDILAIPGSLLGLPGLIGGDGYSLSAFARAGSRVSVMSRETLDSLMLSDPSVSMLILRVLAAEVRTARMALATQ